MVVLSQINWQLEEWSDILIKWVLQNLKSEGAALMRWWPQAWFPIEVDFYEVFAFHEVNMVPFVALRHSQVAGIFSFKLPPPRGLLQNSFSENKLSVGSTMEHHSLESYFVSNVCQSQHERLIRTEANSPCSECCRQTSHLWPQLAHDSRHAMWTLPALRLF